MNEAQEGWSNNGQSGPGAWSWPDPVINAFLLAENLGASAHTLCVCISAAFVRLCVVPTQLWLQEHHVFLPPTSDTVQNRLQKHAGQRGSPCPRRRAPHGAQPNLFPLVWCYFTIRSRNGWRSVQTTTWGGKKKKSAHTSAEGKR